MLRCPSDNYNNYVPGFHVFKVSSLQNFFEVTKAAKPKG